MEEREIETIETLTATLSSLERLREAAQDVLDTVADEEAALEALLVSLGARRVCA